MNVQQQSPYLADAAPGADLLATAETLGQQFAARAAENDEQDHFVAENYALLKEHGLVDRRRPA